MEKPDANIENVGNISTDHVDVIGLLSKNIQGDVPENFNASVARVVAWLMSNPSAQVSQEVIHSFAPGVYIRTMLIKKGEAIVGKIHKKDCVNICVSGDISVTTEMGTSRVHTGFMTISKAGIQKIGFAHEDTVWQNIFTSSETDIQKLENEIAFSDNEAIDIIDPKRIYFKAENLLCQ